MKSIITVILLFVAINSFGQQTEISTQYYYLADKKGSVDSICTVKLFISNTSENHMAIMFSEENIHNHSLEKIIRKKIYRHYGDFSLSIWSENIINNSKYIHFPGMFIKIVNPNEDFEMSIISNCRNETKIKEVLSDYIILCNTNTIDAIHCNLVQSIKAQKADYPYNSITIVWDYLKSYCNK